MVFISIVFVFSSKNNLSISKETCEIQDIVISELVVGYPDKLDT
jgi:hypothetical protein